VPHLLSDLLARAKISEISGKKPGTLPKGRRAYQGRGISPLSNFFDMRARTIIPSDFDSWLCGCHFSGFLKNYFFRNNIIFEKNRNFSENSLRTLCALSQPGEIPGSAMLFLAQ